MLLVRAGTLVCHNTQNRRVPAGPIGDKCLIARDRGTGHLLREKQSPVRVATVGSPVYLARHAEGETRRRPEPRGAERRESLRGRGAGPGAIGKPRAPGTSGRPDGDPSGSSSGPRMAGLTTRRTIPETGGRDLRIATCRRPRPSARTPLGVGSPARHRMGESPERVEASAKAPSGLSRFRGHRTATSVPARAGISFEPWFPRPVMRHGGRSTSPIR